MTTEAPPPADAPRAEGLRRVAIDPLSRVEGHGKVTLLLDDANRVRQARLHIVEFRGFEAFIEGRPYWEVPVMVQRLCGICPVSHQLAAVKAIEAALGITPDVPPVAQAMRRLLHHAQVMQSHALHFFHLASPDLLFGPEAEPSRRHILAVAAAHPQVAREGVALRRFGQQVVEAVSGKRIHGTGAVPGGVNRRLDADVRRALRAEWPAMRDSAERALALLEALHDGAPDLFDGLGYAGRDDAGWMTLVAPDGTLDLYDGGLRVTDAEGCIRHDQVPVDRYAELIAEEVQPWTYMKFPYLRTLGPTAGWYRVGPLARVQAADCLGTPRAEAARRRMLDRLGGAPVQAPLAYHAARLVELLHACERVGEGLDDPRLDDLGPLAVPMPRPTAGQRREGTGVIEAPRGTLIHHYRLDDDDRVAACNLIVSTTHNNRAMNEAVRAAADQVFDGRALTEAMLNRVEVAIRAYDPCLSCATHALGTMPLVVELRDRQGLRDRVVRHGDGRFERGDGDGDGDGVVVA
jgi:NAD-reducing hydrogenase large subunit